MTTIASLNSLLQSLALKYNADLSRLYKTYLTNATKIQRLWTSYANKQKLTNNLTKQYNIDVANLKAKYNSDIAKVKQSLLQLQNSNPQSSTKKALLIGIDYKGTPNELNGCINDVNNMNTLLRSLNYNNITILTDDTSTKPTKTNIINNIISILSNAKDGDNIIIHYSGHGTDTYDSNGDETDKYDECLVPLDLNLLIDDELKNLIMTNLKTKANVIAIFDCCYSGTALDLKYQYLGSYTAPFTKNDKNSETIGNVVLISGCRDDQQSDEALVNNSVQGAMSWAFSEIIKTNPKISWKTLIENMRSLLSSNSFTQVPQLSFGKYIDINSQITI